MSTYLDYYLVLDVFGIDGIAVDDSRSPEDAVHQSG